MSGKNLNLESDEPIFGTKKARKWLKTLLEASDVTIEFEKKDGSLRKMICTLSEQKIPKKKTPKGTGKEKTDEVCAVFDLELQEWRSFRFDSIKRIQFTIE